MKKLFLLFLTAVISVFIYVAIVNFNFLKINRTTSAEILRYSGYEKNEELVKNINTGGIEFKNEIITAINKAKQFVHEKNIKAGIISHHLPTAVPLIAEFYSNLKFANSKIKTFIIIGPDHYERCSFKAATTDKSYNTPFGQLAVDKENNKIFLANGLKIDNNCFTGEHSISVQAIFIKYLFPEAQIIPIIFSSAASEKDLAKVLEGMKKISGSFIIGSLDFSHYQKLNMAEIYDSASQKWIARNQPEKFNLTHIDSPPTIKLLLDYINDQHLKPLILKRTNSFAYTGQAENTTGYMSIFFK